jgi:monovalent cation:H+ antiporter-2, CPA2 family
LGLLFDPQILRNDPFLMLGAFVGLVLLKWTAGTIAVRFTRMRWRSAAGVGLGLAHVGEFAFVLAFTAMEAGLIERDDYQRLLILALGSLLFTPWMIKKGMHWSEPVSWPEHPPEVSGPALPAGIRAAVVIGIGPVGNKIISHLHDQGIQTCAVDLSPVNLHSLAQKGFYTVAGDARDVSVLRSAKAHNTPLILVSVPSDDVAEQIITSARLLNQQCKILVRCRYLANTNKMVKAGADFVISEEDEASTAFLKVLEDAGYNVTA